MNLLVECTSCGNSYARFLLEQEEPQCQCGAGLSLEGPDLQFVDREELLAEEEHLKELSRMASYVCFLILSTDTSKVDVYIKGAELKRRCAELFPDKAHLYDLLYKSRFDRLWKQFREPQ